MGSRIRCSNCGGAGDAAGAVLVCAKCFAKINDAIKDIAKQKLADEIDEETKECADWLLGYEACVQIARSALK